MTDTLTQRRRTSRRSMARWVAEQLKETNEVTIGGLKVRPFRDKNYEPEIRKSLAARVQTLLGKPVKVEAHYDNAGHLTSLTVTTT